MKKSVTVALIIGALFFLTSHTNAQDEKPEKKKEETQQKKSTKTLKQKYAETIVVTASRYEQNYSEVTSTMTVLNREDLDRIQPVALSDALRYIPGVNVQRSGSIGKITSIRMRGSNSNQVLLVVDGVTLNDPALGVPNFAPLTLSCVDRIEVARGGYSPLYGSSAGGGLISIITKSGEGPIHFNFYGEGDYNTQYDGYLTMSGKTGNFSYYADYQTVRSDGQWKNDNYKNNTFNIKLGLDISNSLTWVNTFRYIDSHVGIPIEVFGKQTFDVNAKQDDLGFFGSTHLKAKVGSKWDFDISLGFFSNKQKFKDLVDPGENGPWVMDIGAETHTSIYNFHFTNQVKICESDALTIGLEVRHLEAMSKDTMLSSTNYDENLTNVAFYIQNRLNISGKLFLDTSLRYDDFDEYGDNLNPAIALAYMLNEGTTKFKVSYSTSFRIPSLNELFYPWYGNPELKPEESRHLELGAEQFLINGNLRIGANVFFGDYTNLIGYNYKIFKADNISEATINGLELFTNFTTPFNLSGGVGYTYLFTEDIVTEKGLIRRPNHQGYLVLNWKTGRLELTTLARYVGEQLDNPVVGFPEMNEAFCILNLNARYLLVDGIRIFTRFTNLLDAEYYEVKGFPARGKTMFVGISFL